MWIKTKYRVKQIGNKFYPQYKKFLYWKYIKVRRCFKDSYSDRITNVDNDLFTVVCYNLKLALNFISVYKNNYLPKFKFKGFLIRSYFCEKEYKFYYIEVNQHKFSSDCSEQIFEQILLYLDEKKENERLANQVKIHAYAED